MKYKFEITRIELVKNSFGKNDLIIKQVKVLDENGKYIKFAKLNEALLNALKESENVTIKNKVSITNKEDYEPDDRFNEGSYGDMVDCEIKRLMDNPNS